MASEIRVNQIQNRSGLGTVTFSDTGVIISGITTISDLRTSGTTVVAAGSASVPSISPSGDNNTGIFFPAADTIALGTNGSESVRITSFGSLSAYTTDTGGHRLRSSSASSGNLTALEVLNSATSTTNGTVVARIRTNGDIQTNGNIILSTSGAGIDFSATANSSGTMTSELLSDYEEGTWTPIVSFGGGSTGITYSTQSGGYIKIGNKVTVWFYLQLSNKGSSTGDSKISGLPYTNGNATGRSEGATMTPNYWTGFNSAIIPGGYVQGNQSLIYMINTDGSMNTGTIANTVWSNSSAIYGCATYSTV